MLWTEERIAILKKDYPIYGAKKLAEQFNCAITTVRQKASELKIKTFSDGRWKNEDILILKEYYESLGSLEISKIINRDFRSIQSKAHYLGLKTGNLYGEMHPNFKGFKNILGSVMGNLRHRGHTCTITPEIIYNILEKQNWKCFYSGLDISFENKTASVDRINSDIGYIEENVQMVHKSVNSMKMRRTHEEFLDLIKKIVLFSKGEKQIKAIPDCKISSYKIRQMQRHARGRSLSIDILSGKESEMDYLNSIATNICPISGMTLSYPTRVRDYFCTASLDRINPKEGYIKGNVRWVHRIINEMKWDLNDQEFFFFINSIGKEWNYL